MGELELPTAIRQIAPWLFITTLLWCCGCLAYGHRSGQINLWTLITASKGEKQYVDPKKLAYIGVFVVMTIGFSYLSLFDRLSEWYAGIYVGAFVLGKWLGDREQRIAQVAKEGATR